MATTTARRKTTTEKGLGWRHQQAVEQLKRRHRDGTPCDWCGQPMYMAAHRNWDFDPEVPGSGTLHGDHGEMTRAEAMRRGVAMPLPDRLLHRKCNQQRGDGVNDHLAVANRGKTTTAPSTGQHTTLNQTRAMDWPW